MNPPLSGDDFKRLVMILSERPGFLPPGPRLQYIYSLIQSSPKAAVLLGTMPVAGLAAHTDAVTVIHALTRFGQDVAGREVLTVLVRSFLEEMGEGEDASFLRGLFERYPLETTPNFARQIIILFMAANPTDEAALRTDAEQRDIGKALRESEYRERFKLESQPALRVDDLQNAVLQHKPQIVHFAGHGGGQEGLIFEDDKGKGKAAPLEAVAGLFELLEPPVDIVVLNACYSKLQADLILPHVKAVIGMFDAIGDRSATQFAIGFYRGLGYGLSIEKAFNLGINQMGLMGSRQTTVPVLQVNPSVEPGKMKLVQ